MIDPVKTDQATAPKIKIRIIMYTISIIKKKIKIKKKSSYPLGPLLTSKIQIKNHNYVTLRRPQGPRTP